LNGTIILFDLEYTAWEGSKARNWSEPWEHREIIQIAAIRVAINGRVAELGCFDRLVRPKLNPILSPYITHLTGIQQEAMETWGTSFAEAFCAFYGFCDQGRLPLFCYGDDLAILLENFTLNNIESGMFPLMIRDIRPVFEAASIDTRLYSSGTVYQALGMEFDQAAHNALNDVRSLAVTLQQLMRMGKLKDGWVEKV
jgi:inhibitor of KinA sporulation pathway (predicted exonuclease)